MISNIMIIFINFNKCRCSKISDSNNNVLGKWTGEKCANFEDACPEYLKRYVTCRLDFCEGAGVSGSFCILEMSSRIFQKVAGKNPNLTAKLKKIRPTKISITKEKLLKNMASSILTISTRRITKR